MFKNIQISKADRTKESIRTTATKIFQKKGFDSVTMRELAEACDLSLGAFYYHYKSKEEVVLEIFNSSLIGHVTRTETYLESAPKKLDKVMEWVCRDRFEEFKNERSMLRVLAQRIDPEDPLSPWHKSSDEIRQQSYLLFEKVVSHCLPNLEPKTNRLLAQALWLHHLVILGYWSFDRSKNDMKTEAILVKASSFWKGLPLALKVPGVKSVLSSLFSPLFQFIDSEEK